MIYTKILKSVVLLVVLVGVLQVFFACSSPNIFYHQIMEAIGFMFGSNRGRTSKIFHYGEHAIVLNFIDDDPGHVQSGLYLWPAADTLCHYILEFFRTYSVDLVIELGAGCGLVGLLTSKLPGNNGVILTDYDPGSIEVLCENVDANLCDAVCPIYVEQLEWGERLTNFLMEKLLTLGSHQILVAGSDLLYCVSIVRPLFCTVVDILKSRKGSFILSTSFDVGDDIEKAVFSICEKNLIRYRFVNETNKLSSNICIFELV